MRQIVIVLTVVLGLVTGCGTDRPSEDELAEALVRPNAVVPIPKGSERCVAKVLEDSELSDGTLRAITENKPRRKVPAGDRRLLERLFDRMADCIPN